MNFATKLITTILFSVSLLACKKEQGNTTKEYKYDFNEGLQGWNILFSDYPVGEEANHELIFEHAGLPASLNDTCKSIKVGGNNHSDDLMSMLYRKIDGLEPNTNYYISFSVDLASNACISCAGAGGSPNLCLGGGILSFLPENEIENSSSKPMYRPNFVSEIQSCLSNDSISALGKIGVSDEFPTPYKLININNTDESIRASTNNIGELWVLVGTDSGFEGITTLYYKQITIHITNYRVGI